MTSTLRAALPLLLTTLLLLVPTPGRALDGTWTLYPPQGTVYTTAVQPPINADGSSTWPKRRGVIPVQFELLSAPGPVVFQSIGSDSETANDFSFLSFTPSTTLLFSDITTLSAVYAFTTGNCHGGALRWSVKVDIGNDGDPSNDGNVFIYYGAYPNFTDCTTTSQSGVNMIGQSDLRYDTSQVGGTFYDSHANAQTLVGALPVIRVSLVLDGGWAGDQRLTLGNVTVNDNTFVPASGPPTRTCDLPTAYVSIAKTAGAGTGDISAPESIQQADDDLTFRIVDCKYMYNLNVSSLGILPTRDGKYEVRAVIDGSMTEDPAKFELR